MNIIETDYWCLMLPPEWSAEQEEDVIRIFDQDEIGELALTTLIRDSDADESSSTIQLAKVSSHQRSPIGQRSSLAPLRACLGFFEEDETWVREWYLSHQSVLLYVTYICDREDAGMDDAAVAEILGTLVPGDAIAAR